MAHHSLLEKILLHMPTDWPQLAGHGSVDRLVLLLQQSKWPLDSSMTALHRDPIRNHGFT